MANINNIRPRTVIIASVITVIVVMVFFDYLDKSRADKIEITQTGVTLTYPKKSVTLNYDDINNAMINCANKGNHCGVVIISDKKYYTKPITNSDNAKKNA